MQYVVTHNGTQVLVTSSAAHAMRVASVLYGATITRKDPNQ